MKKLLVTIVIVLFAVVGMNSQTKAVKVNPVGIVFGIGNAGFEFATNDAQSLTISALYMKIQDISGIGAGLEYRFYFEESIEKWYAAPVAAYLSLKSGDESAGIFTAGAIIGHQWIFGEHFLLDLNAGYGAYFGGDNLEGLSGGGISLGLSIGYAW